MMSKVDAGALLEHGKNNNVAKIRDEGRGMKIDVAISRRGD